MTSMLRSFLLWLLPAIVVAIAVARVSVWVQPHFAPLVLFPLLIGAALGAMFCGLLQVARLSDTRLAVTGTVLMTVLAAAAEHGFFYLDHRVERARKALEAGITEDVLPPMGFLSYMHAQSATDRLQVPLWIGNATAMVVAAIGVVIWCTKSRAVANQKRDHPSPQPEGEEAGRS